MSEFKNKREEMVERQLVNRGITNERVLDAMRTIPREKFVPARMTGRAYDDSALPIGSTVQICVSEGIIVTHRWVTTKKGLLVRSFGLIKNLKPKQRRPYDRSKR